MTNTTKTTHTNRPELEVDDADETAAEEAARRARLLRISPDQITNYSYETILDWLDARREHHVARLRTLVGELRAASDDRAAAHERLARAVAAVSSVV
jgi:hypothetical protein